jgi:hypothetical protein
MLAFPVEVDSVLTPSVEVGDELELLTEPRVKRMGDFEASIQSVLIRRSRRLKPTPVAKASSRP